MSRMKCGVKTFWRIDRLNNYLGFHDSPDVGDDLRVDYSQEFENQISDEGLEHLLSVVFAEGTPITAWFIELFESNTSIGGDETYAVPVYTPTTAYDETTRPAWTPGAVSVAANVASVSNLASQASFTFNATKTIYGGALVGGGTDGSTIADAAGGGTLYAVAQFTAPVGVVSSTVLKVQVTSTAKDTATA